MCKAHVICVYDVILTALPSPRSCQLSASGGWYREGCKGGWCNRISSVDSCWNMDYPPNHSHVWHTNCLSAPKLCEQNPVSEASKKEGENQESAANTLHSLVAYISKIKQVNIKRKEGIKSGEDREGGPQISHQQTTISCDCGAHARVIGASKFSFWPKKTLHPYSEATLNEPSLSHERCLLWRVPTPQSSAFLSFFLKRKIGGVAISIVLANITHKFLQSNVSVYLIPF